MLEIVHGAFLPIKNVCAQAPGAGQAVISSI